MPQLVPLYFINEVAFAFIFSTVFIITMIMFYELSNSINVGLKTPVNTYSFIKMKLQSACSHGVVGVCALCIQAQQAKIAACTHKWSIFSDSTFVGVACDFNLPEHVAATQPHSIVHYCTVCHAVVCSGCFSG